MKEIVRKIVMAAKFERKDYNDLAPGNKINVGILVSEGYLLESTGGCVGRVNYKVLADHGFISPMVVKEHEFAFANQERKTLQEIMSRHDLNNYGLVIMEQIQKDSTLVDSFHGGKWEQKGSGKTLKPGGIYRVRRAVSTL